MKLAIGLMTVVALAAGPAWAQASWGSKPKSTWTPGGVPASPSAPRSYGVPPVTPAPAYGGGSTARIYSPPAAPKAEPFKPYQPYKPANVFGPDGKKKR